MQGWEVSRAMEFGSASASIVISRHSCSEAMPTVTEVEEFLETAVRA
jgi:5-dehydro-2-deoxygluconokinase